MNHLKNIQTVFREIFEDPALVIEPATSPASLPEWDSVAQVHILLALEETYSMRFTTTEVAGIKSVADFLKVFEDRA